MIFKPTPLFLGLCCFVFSVFANWVQSTPSFNGMGFGSVATLITLQTANRPINSERSCLGFGNSITGCGIAANGRIESSPMGQRAVFLETVAAAGIPEPASYGLLGFALVVGFVISRRRNREMPAVRTKPDLSPIPPTARNNSSLTPADRA